MSTHQCPRTGCVRQVRAEMLACREHWQLVSASTRARVWSAWTSRDFFAHQRAIRQAIDEMNAAPGGGS
jgi:hypothetical protein